MNKYLPYIYVIATAIVLLLGFGVGYNSNSKYRKEIVELRNNQSTLLGSVQRYKTSDSLNAVKIGTLQLTVDELNYFRAEDAKTIKSLKTKNRELTEVNTAQTQMLAQFQVPVADTVVIIANNLDTLKKVEYHDNWIDFNGTIKEGKFDASIQVRDSLLLVESVTYKRFLGFLWRTKKIKTREVDAVSKNPYTTIQSIEHINILKK